MNARAAELVERLDLRAHPEGGYYREQFRSPVVVTPGDPRGERQAVTAIHFLLTAGMHSRWHRLRSDEVWSHLEGDPVRVWLLDEGEGPARPFRLGRAGAGVEPVCAVPAGAWQAAEVLGEYALVSCVVAPGFEFADFQLLADHAEARLRLERRSPELVRLA